MEPESDRELVDGEKAEEELDIEKSAGVGPFLGSGA